MLPKIEPVIEAFTSHSHGHGILHLQTSNQSPETFHFGTVLAVTVLAASISTKNRDYLIRFIRPTFRQEN